MKSATDVPLATPHPFRKWVCRFSLITLCWSGVGPCASRSDGPGTCGNDWATDTVNRHFTVFSNPEGTFTVVEHFKDGTFITPASDGPPVNFSPGACQASPTPAGVVNNGIAGEFQ